MSEQHVEHAHAGLIRYDAMLTAIAACAELDEVKGIRDRAVALEHYSRQAKNLDAEKQCAEIRIRAERKAGQLLKRIERRPGLRTDLRTDPSTTSRRKGEKSEPLVQTFSKQLEDLKVSEKEARNWQDLADVAEEKFEDALAQPGVPTTSGIISEAHPKPKTIEATTPSEWFCNWLLSFEDEGMLEADPTALVSDMTPTQADKVHKLAPAISDWLWQLSPPAPEPDAA